MKVLLILIMDNSSIHSYFNVVSCVTCLVLDIPDQWQMGFVMDVDPASTRLVIQLNLVLWIGTLMYLGGMLFNELLTVCRN